MSEHLCIIFKTIKDVNNGDYALFGCKLNQGDFYIALSPDGNIIAKHPINIPFLKAVKNREFITGRWYLFSGYYNVTNETINATLTNILASEQKCVLEGEILDESTFKLNGFVDKCSIQNGIFHHIGSLRDVGGDSFSLIYFTDMVLNLKRLQFQIAVRQVQQKADATSPPASTVRTIAPKCLHYGNFAMINCQNHEQVKNSLTSITK
jgi:hypothetical protein